MKIGNVMSRDVQLIKPDDTIRSAAALMKKIDAGLLPVTEDDKLVGMITDRDIAIRGVAEGKGPDAKVRDAMSPEVKYCFEDENVAHVAENMAELQVRRLPVMNRDKLLVGIVRSRILRSKVRCRKQQRSGLMSHGRLGNSLARFRFPLTNPISFLASMRVGIDFGEFCAEQKNLSGIIDPQQKDDQPAGSSKAGSNCTASDVPANERLSDAEEHRGNDCADHHVAP